MQFAQRMLRFLKSPVFQIILYCMDQKKRWSQGLTWHWWSSKKNEFMSQDVLLMIIWEKTKTKLQTESSWNTQNNEYSRVRTSTIRVLSGFWRKVSHFFTDKNKNSRARFWSSDLWVMGPARFHCATLLCLWVVSLLLRLVRVSRCLCEQSAKVGMIGTQDTFKVKWWWLTVALESRW